MKYFFVILRIFIGLVFLVSGFEKSVSPYQNFLYALQGYQFLPSFLEIAVAKIVPWIELLIGVFLVLGLWTRQALFAAAVMFTGFIIIVGQALIRGIDLAECGCFGEWIHIPPQGVIVMDAASLIVCLVLLKKLSLAQTWSLDSRLPSA
ncbi:MAG: hypothetical protein COW13_01230 [Candidatus Omnitrophica bacterium CG12_big_fil_rev_8_21_14_0_65_50_5]|nr:MAG: hypothetical protein COW13_01230 [Candidatus Omnitrophica bacterium CG12_big_fil_rev_8_21_14_0_65_50_5]